MKHSLAVLISVGVLTFTFVQCKTSKSDSTTLASTPKTSSAGSTEAPAPVISSPADAAQATIAASQAYINSSDPCTGLDASTCSTLKDAATQTAAADPNALATQLTPENVTDVTNTVTPPTDTASSTEATTNSETSVAISTSTQTSNNTGAKVAVGLGVPILILGLLIGVGTVKDYMKMNNEIKNKTFQITEDKITKTYSYGTMHGTRYLFENTPHHTRTQVTDSNIIKNIEEQANEFKRKIISKQIKKYPKLGAVAATLILGGLASTIYGASVLNSSTGLADGTTDSTPAQTYINTLNSIGQQIVNNFH